MSFFWRQRQYRANYSIRRSASLQVFPPGLVESGATPGPVWVLGDCANLFLLAGSFLCLGQCPSMWASVSNRPRLGEGTWFPADLPWQRSSPVLQSPASLAALARASLDSQLSPPCHETPGSVWVLSCPVVWKLQAASSQGSSHLCPCCPGSWSCHACGPEWQLWLPQSCPVFLFKAEGLIQSPVLHRGWKQQPSYVKYEFLVMLSSSRWPIKVVSLT